MLCRPAQGLRGERREASQRDDDALPQHVIAVALCGIQQRRTGSRVPPLRQAKRGHATHAILWIKQAIKQGLERGIRKLAQGLQSKPTLDQVGGFGAAQQDRLPKAEIAGDALLQGALALAWLR